MNIVQENEKLKECIVAPSTTQQKQSLTSLVSQENTNVGLDKYIIISTEQSVFVRQLSCYSATNWVTVLCWRILYVTEFKYVFLTKNVRTW